MMRLLTEEQKDLLAGVELRQDNFFNPIQDANGNWVISEEEVSACANQDYLWVRDLELTEYKQPKGLFE